MDDSQNQNIWDANADAWATAVRSTTPDYRRLVVQPAFFAAIGNVGGLRILDVACGEGSIARELALAGATVVGVDISPRMIALAAAQTNDNVSYVCSDVSKLTAKELGHFDLATCFMGFMNIEQLGAALASIRQLLSNSGRLMIAVLHPCFSTRRSFWIKEKDGALGGLFVSGYFVRGSYMQESSPCHSLTGDSKSVSIIDRRYHRTLEDYFKVFCEGGFYVSHLLEPTPHSDQLAQHPWLTPFANHAGAALIVELRKSEYAGDRDRQG